MGLKKFSATLKYESTGCVQYGDTYSSRGHENGNGAIIATIEKLAWIAGVAEIGSLAVEAFNNGLREGQAHIIKYNAAKDTNDIPWTHRMTADGGYEIGYFGADGFVKTEGEVASLETANALVNAHNGT